MHDDHLSLTGYDPDQIWHDGCEECEHRGRRPEEGMMTFDRDTLEKAWTRSARWNRQETENDVYPTLSEAERPLLTLLWRMQVLLERNCGVPIGVLPGAGAWSNPYSEGTAAHRSWAAGWAGSAVGDPRLLARHVATVRDSDTRAYAAGWVAREGVNA